MAITTKALRFFRAAALPSAAGSAAQGDIYFIKPSSGDGQIYVCTSLDSSSIPQFVKYGDATVYTHPTVNVYKGTSSASPAHGEPFTVIDSITTNTQGHVTAINTKTVTLPADSNTHYTTHLYAGSGTAANAATTNGNTKLTICDDTTVRNTVTVKGSGKASVTSDASGVITINAAAGTYEETPGSGSKTASDGAYINAVSLSADHKLTAGEKAFITDIASNSNSKIAPTTAAVKSYVDSAIVSAIHIKGTIGSTGADITALPTSAVVGDAYVVKTAGTYADQKCEVGDIIICTTASTTAPTWTVIQNNLDVATADKLGTIKIGYQTTSGKNYAVQLDSSNKAYVNVPWIDTDTKVTSVGNHYTPAADSASQLSVDASSTTAAAWNSTSLVTGVNLQRDAKGHVVGVTVDSIKMPANPNSHHTNYLQINGNGTEAVKFTQNADKTLNFAPGNKIGISATAGTITINHVGITAPTPAAGKALTPGYGESFTYISALTEDGYGHVTGITTQKVTLPSAYSLPTASTTTKGGIKIGTSLEMSGEVCNVVWTDFGS